MALLPMFPLGSVLMPGAVLPLHVFEPRYRELVHDCIESPDHEFGVVLIDRGHEVGGGDQRRPIGVAARILQVAEMEGDRYALVTVGTRRFKVSEWLPDSPYPVADVIDLPDGEPGCTTSELVDKVEQVHAQVRRTLGMASELGDTAADATSPISDEPHLATFHLAALAPLGADDMYRLLAAPDPLQRLSLLTEMLDDAEAAMRFRLMTGSDPIDPLEP